ncbi:hypothetical protein QBC32DRAFT_327662 [Pseudoneurospora amorphoporcata]|uniref:Uncharacterized protein n=1 Tax=Pseudoneurospora amorphoporcata TaxID=241081 RepID=A0AAN6NP45_9PEZI|nr:hypothetical protein QBC32DRAFT_327662 [Pseudoneurospora amorphoporcata]
MRQRIKMWLKNRRWSPLRAIMTADPSPTPGQQLPFSPPRPQRQQSTRSPLRRKQPSRAAKDVGLVRQSLTAAAEAPARSPRRSQGLTLLYRRLTVCSQHAGATPLAEAFLHSEIFDIYKGSHPVKALIWPERYRRCTWTLPDVLQGTSRGPLDWHVGKTDSVAKIVDLENNLMDYTYLARTRRRKEAQRRLTDMPDFELRRIKIGCLNTNRVMIRFKPESTSSVEAEALEIVDKTMLLSESFHVVVKEAPYAEEAPGIFGGTSESRGGEVNQVLAKKGRKARLIKQGSRLEEDSKKVKRTKKYVDQELAKLEKKDSKKGKKQQEDGQAVGDGKRCAKDDTFVTVEEIDPSVEEEVMWDEH